MIIRLPNLQIIFQSDNKGNIFSYYLCLYLKTESRYRVVYLNLAFSFIQYFGHCSQIVRHRLYVCIGYYKYNSEPQPVFPDYESIGPFKID